MANFKNPLTNADISSLGVDASGKARFRLWGGDGSGGELIVRVYRSGTVVSEGGGVTLNSTPAGNWNFDYTATGLKPGDQIYGLTSLGIRYTGALSVVAAGGATSKNHLIDSWAAHYRQNPKPSSDYLYPGAVPYLALKDPKQGACPRLAEKCIGGPLAKVSGLAVHCTAGGAVSAFHMAAWHCVPTWNANSASAHFGIGGEGQVVQFISADRIANAQRDPGNLSWLSVEVANPGQKQGMNVAQLTALKQLFLWVRKTFGVPNQVGTGYLGGDPNMNKLTEAVCSAAMASVTRDPIAPASSRGLSCHHWLDKGVKPCPGQGILAQLPSVIKAGPVS
jgi:hypothetical protein